MAYEEATGNEGETAADPRQRSKRMLVAQVQSPRFGRGSIVVRDISRGGLGGMTSQWLRPGERLEADLPSIGSIAARVAWTDGNRFGLEFDEEIDADRVTRERVPAEVAQFRVLDRFRPEVRSGRPAIGLR
jgi:hypothetical protein